MCFLYTIYPALDWHYGIKEFCRLNISKWMLKENAWLNPREHRNRWGKNIYPLSGFFRFL